MLKKSFVLITLVLCLFFISTVVFAENDLKDAAQGVRNVVGGAENVIEDAVTGIGNGIRDGFDAVTEHDDTDRQNNNVDTFRKDTAGTGSDGYTATRTSTGLTNNGMDNTIWTWFVLAILGIVIISLVWYYAKQNSNNNHIHDDE